VGMILLLRRSPALRNIAWGCFDRSEEKNPKKVQEKKKDLIMCLKINYAYSNNNKNRSKNTKYIKKKKKKNSANSDLLITFTLYSFNNSDLQIKAVLTPITADPHPTI